MPKGMCRARMTRTARLSIFVGLLWALGALAGGATLPAGFQETLVFSGLTHPTNVRFASDGRVFVAEKSGLIKVFSSLSATTPTIFADLRTEVDDYWDRGLLGLALHPNFPTTPYVYVLYTYDAPIGGTAPTWNDNCPNPPGATTNGCVVSGRLSRLTASGSVMTGSEQVLLEAWGQQFPSHSIGDLVFGSDGALYVSGGEGASFDNVDYGQYGSPVNPLGDPPAGVGGAQTPPTAEGGALRSLSLLRVEGGPVLTNGAILRVDAGGNPLPDNPLYGSSDQIARRVIAHGLRNPFRFTIQPGSGSIWIGDVGWATWEEIDRIVDPTGGVVNFGWPCYEGAGRQSGYDAANLNLCENLYSSLGATAPFYTYNHSALVVSGESCSVGSSSISGLAFYSGGGYPSAYDGALFFADYSRNCAWVMFPDASGQPNASNRATFIAGASTPVDLEIGPGGDLFYVDHAGGTIRRVQYVVPKAVATATPTSGTAPLTVQFDGSGSAPAQPGDTITYAWDLDGDGAYDDSTAVQPAFVYGVSGVYVARLRVTDNHGVSALSDPITIAVGNAPPTAVIDSPASTLTWRVGSSISFSGHATDPEDGNLPASALTWNVMVHHCPSNCHLHALQTFTGVASGSFAAPDHEYPSYLELQLTATDSGGLQNIRSVLLYPQTVTLSFESTPSALQLTVGTGGGITPFAKTVIVGSNNTISAPSPQGLGASSYGFASWSDGGAQTHNVVAGSSPATYQANYVAVSLPPPWAEKDIGAVSLPGSAIVSGGTFTVAGSGADIWSSSDQFHFVYQPLSGDGTIVARVPSIQNTNVWAKVGVMIRESLAANSTFADMLLTPGSGGAFQRRATTGGSGTTTNVTGPAPPYWVQLVRTGTSFTGFVSADGATWSLIGSATVSMATNVYVGLAVTSHSPGVLCTATFDNVTFTPQAPDVPPTVSITSPIAGAVFYAPATIPLAATASDSDGTVAKVDFYSGTTLLATVTSAPYTYNWSNVAVGSYSLTARATDDKGATTTSAPVSITVSSSSGSLPAPWLDQDIGVLGVPGSASYSNGTFTVAGSGTDIWSSSDQFHFVYQPMSGDGQIVAWVASVQNTNAAARSGVMIRRTLAADSNYAAMFITPGAGADFQRRTTNGGNTASSALAGIVAPYWVRVTRRGKTLTGSISADGVHWVQVGQVNINMGSSVYLGLAVTSHDNTALCTASFNGVTATP
jgi:glucose/arabinose dehydrogenase/regulation of enolase protein 1 (concanavalin A-like superfamily)